MRGYHFAIRSAAPWIRRLEDVRWSLLAANPSGRRMRYGAFAASDGEFVPYRLWLPRKSRANILLLHGCFDYSGAFDSVAPKLVRSGFAVMAYDQRGFGATASRGKWSGARRLIDDLADAARFCRSRVDPDVPLFLVGESMGGAVAVHGAARERGIDPAGLILVAPGALASAFRNSLYGVLLHAMRAIVGNMEVVVERVDDSDLTPAAAIRLLGDPLVMRGITPDLLEGVLALAHSAVNAAKDVTVPTLTMVGTRDDLLRRACVEQLHDNLAGPKSWAAIKGGPHLLLHWEKGGAVLRTMRKWIERHI